MKRISCAVVAALVMAAGTGAALGVQFPTMAPGYTQQIYTGPLAGGPGMAWTGGGNLLTRNGSTILEYDTAAAATHQGTSVHGVIASHPIAGLSNTGAGMTNGLDGYIYAVSGSGLERFNPSNWAAPAQFMPGSVGGQGYGVTTLPDGRIAYSDGSSTSSVWVYDPVAMTNTWVYTAQPGQLIDGMQAGPGGNIALAIQSVAAITIITSSGGLVNSFSTPHFPDGLAFSASSTSSVLYSNNNDGTVSRYVLGPAFTGTPTITDIAGISGAYGDLASVGPDCAFYVSQFDNGGYHGSVAGIGTHWDNAVTNNEPSIVRIGGLTTQAPDGTEECAFYTPIEGGVSVPEAGTLAMLAAGVMAVGTRRRRGMPS